MMKNAGIIMEFLYSMKGKARYYIHLCKINL